MAVMSCSIISSRFLSTAAAAASLPLLVGGQNWLLQCSPCVDQALFSDSEHKSNIQEADLTNLYRQIKEMQLSVYDNAHDEFYNKFFSRQQVRLFYLFC